MIEYALLFLSSAFYGSASLFGCRSSSTLTFRKQLLHSFPRLAAESLQLQTHRCSTFGTASRMLHPGCFIRYPELSFNDCYWGNLRHSVWILFKTTVEINLPVGRIVFSVLCSLKVSLLNVGLFWLHPSTVFSVTFSLVLFAECYFDEDLITSQRILKRFTQKWW